MVALLRKVGGVEYGYRVQGLAAHVLLRLGEQPTIINASGHPDIVATSASGEVRLEIEADLGSHGARNPTVDDLSALRPRTAADSGFFAYLVAGPKLRWLLVPYEALVERRRPIPIAIAAALADREKSAVWTDTMNSLVCQHQERLWYLSFSALTRRALSGKGL